MTRALHLAPSQPEAHLKESQRQELDDAVTRFLAEGGRIESLSNGARSPQVEPKRRGKAAKANNTLIFSPKATRFEPSLALETSLEGLDEDEATTEIEDP
jgi:hypothetical protein